MRILAISSSRADVGIFLPIWRQLCGDPDVELHVMLTGMHAGRHEEVRAQIPEGAICHTGGSDIGGGSAEQAAQAMGDILAATGKICAAVTPDIILVIGDRLDMAPAVLGSVPFNIPVAHVHGGEVTEGAVDDRLRHAVTKMAHLHFTANADAACRISAMGEEAWRIHVCGAPGLDTLRSVPPRDRSAVLQAIGLADTGPLRLVTLHPETNAADSLAPMAATLSALERLPPEPTLFTSPNSDPGGMEMRAQILEFCSWYSWAGFRDTLGSDLYVNAMRHAAVMVGNSSSGIVEAPLLGLPVVNVGNRQRGRMTGCNVTHCANDDHEMAAVLERMSAAGYHRLPASFPYGDGHAAPRIVALLRRFGQKGGLLHKTFDAGGHGFVVPWDMASAAEGLPN